MLFGSPVFLFLFLPLVLALHLVPGQRARNVVLLLASLFFYAWGEQEYLLLLLLSIGLNHLFGRLVEREREEGRGRVALLLGVAFNVGLLAVFKYLGFLLEATADLLGPLGVPEAWIPRVDAPHLPLGISFFTFQALSYLVDIHRGRGPALASPLRFALYISFFPQLIAGPIVRCREVADQLAARTIGREGFAAGVHRFVVGLAKKLLVADVLGATVDRIFLVPSSELTTSLAWLGAAGFALQLYFDFSGYSDMAIGLGRMFGLRLPENFDHPYVARSLTGFWRRWHITLSTWLRDYVFFALGGNWKGPSRTVLNLMAVFLLCGLWHGAGWNFVAWGALHGLLMVAEWAGLGAWLARAPRVVGHAYLVGAFLLTLVVFRCPTLAQGGVHVLAMLGFAQGSGEGFPLRLFADPLFLTAFTAGVLGSMPLVPWLRTRAMVLAAHSRAVRGLSGATALLLHAGLLALCACQVANGTYDPFIYFRF